MKRTFSFLLSLIMIIGIISGMPLKVTAASVDDLTFELNEDGTSYSVTDCAESAEGEIIIPDTYNGLPVTRIGYGAFSDCFQIESVVIPESIVSIGSEAFSGTGYYNDEDNWENGVLYIGNHLIVTDNSSISGDYVVKEGTKTIAEQAFYYCGDITSITVPDSVTNIGDEAFSHCGSLTSITLSNNITSIGVGLFSGNSNLTSITIPENVTSIGLIAFYGCEGLTSINLPDNLTSIGEYAFEGCNSLAMIKIPSSVVEIGVGAFSKCENLTSIEVAEENADFSSLDGVLFNKNYTTLLQFPGGKTFYDIPNGVITIGERAFRHCEKLASVTIPDSVINIADYAFTNTALTNVTIPDSVTEMGEGVFYGCLNLESVKLPKNIKNIEERTFGYCESLVSITLPDNLKSIGIWAFYGCDAFTEFIIPDGVTSIGGSAFYDCKNLKSVTVPESVTFIGSVALGFLKYALEPGNPDFVIYGKKGTVAETYANENGFTFKVICKHPSTKWVTDTEATVYKAGSKHKECTECGEVLETAEIAQLKCSKPTLKTISNTQYGVKITWGKVKGADKYYVYRKVKGGSYSRIGSTTNTYYTDKTAKSGKKYYYIVKAINEVGASSSSSALSKRYLADPTLKTPTSTKSGVSLKWTKSAGAEGYIIYRKTGSGSYTKLKTEKGVSNLSYVDASAKKGKKYTYKVKAYKSKTYSAYSNTKTITDKY